MFRRIVLTTLVAALAATIIGCGTRRTTTSPSPSVSPSPSPSPTSASVACSQLTGGVQTHAYLTDVRLEGGQGFDRITFEFKPAAGQQPLVPTYEVRRTTPPFTRDPTDEQFEVTGAYHMAVTFHGGTGVEIAGETPTIHYKGKKEIKPALDVIVEAEELSDFEATLTWVMGTIRPSCPTATVGSDPPRLVLDFPH